VNLSGMEHDRRPGSQGSHLQGLKFASQQQVPRIGWNETINETVGLLGMRISGADATANVLDDEQGSVWIRLNSLKAPASDDRAKIFHFGRDVQRCLPPSTSV